MRCQVKFSHSPSPDAPQHLSCLEVESGLGNQAAIGHCQPSTTHLGRGVAFWPTPCYLQERLTGRPLGHVSREGWGLQLAANPWQPGTCKPNQKEGSQGI